MATPKANPIEDIKKDTAYNAVMAKKGKYINKALRDQAKKDKEKQMQEQLEREAEAQRKLEEEALKNNGSSVENRDENLKNQEAAGKAEKEKKNNWFKDFGKGFVKGLGFWHDAFMGTDIGASPYDRTKTDAKIKGGQSTTEGSIVEESSTENTGNGGSNPENERPKGLSHTEPLRQQEAKTQAAIDYDIDKEFEKVAQSRKSKSKVVDPHLKERLPKTLIAAYKSGFGTNDTPAEIKAAKKQLSVDIKDVTENFDKKIMDAEFDFKAGKISEADYKKTVDALESEKQDRISGLKKDYDETFGESDKSNKRALFYFAADAIAKGLLNYKVAGAQGGTQEAGKPAYKEMLETNLSRGVEAYNKRFDAEMDDILAEIRGTQEEKDKIRNVFMELYADESLKPMMQSLSIYNKKQLAKAMLEYGADVDIGDVITAAKGAYLLNTSTNPGAVKEGLEKAGGAVAGIAKILTGGKL